MSIGDVTDRIAQLSVSKRTLFESRLSELGLDGVIRKYPAFKANEEVPVARVGSDRLKQPNDAFPLVVHAPNAQPQLTAWIEENSAWIQENLRKSGAILFRDFHVDGPSEFEQCIELACGKTTDYPGLAQGVVLRQHIHGKIYTSTEYSPMFRIRLHNECAFANTWPAQICFFCVTAPASGGETPIADSRRVLIHIKEETLDRLTKHGILYVRNFGYGSSRTWEQAFATTDKSKVEEICNAEGVTCEWLDRSRLRTRAVRPPVARHPITGEVVWFNHINASHISSLEPGLRDGLLTEFGKDNLPRNCYYGDGTDIDQTVIDEIQQAYEAQTEAYGWQPGDLLMLDNMLTAHGRNPFTGQRKIVVGMAGSIKRTGS